MDFLKIFVQVERGISQALLDLEVNSDLKAQLRELHITAAKVGCCGDWDDCGGLVVIVVVLSQLVVLW